MSSYKTINGVKMEKKLLDLADECVAGKGDGRVSYADARLLWTNACDGPGVTPVERGTLAHILATYKCTAAGRKFLTSMTADVVSGTSYYKQVKGTKYVRALLDKAETLAKDGKLDKTDALALWKLGMNGGTVTETEKKTVEFFMKNHTLTSGAKAFFEEKLSTMNTKTSESPKKGSKSESPKTAKTAEKRKNTGGDSEPKAPSPKKQKKLPEETKVENKEEDKEEEEEDDEGPELIFLPVTKKCKLKDFCLEQRLPYFHGCGYYQLGTTGKKEKVQGYKKMVARNTATKEILSGGDEVRKRFNLGTGDVQLSKADVPEGWQIFCQSTSSTRQLHPDSIAVIASGSGEKKTKSSSTTTRNHSNSGEYNQACAGGRAHFTGCLMGDTFEDGWVSKCFVEDKYSEYVGVGAYPSNMTAFPNAIRTTFDAIAVDAGTRVTIYAKPGFQGEVLYSRIGPAVVINGKWNKMCPDRIKRCLGKWSEPLNTIFPKECRELSDTDMHEWNTGSLIISEGESLPDNVKLAAEYKAIPDTTDE